MKKVFIITLLFIICALWSNSLPVVENFEFTQRRDGSKIVDVFYDVMDADGDTLSVSMLVSDDGGETWEVNVNGILNWYSFGTLNWYRFSVNFALHSITVTSHNYRFCVMK